VQIIQKIKDIIEPVIDSYNAFLVDIEIRGSQSGKIVEIFIDNDEGITTDLCAKISREISPMIDTASILQQRYYLVVSSPGIERPIKYSRQYPKNIGREFLVKYNTEKGVDRVQGILSAVSSGEITIRTKEGSERKVIFSEIIEARVIASL
jgi:ribosome maturation factor RimP